MLKDRRALLEHDLHKATKAAAVLYLKLVTTSSDVHSAEYDQLKQKISQLQFDLTMVVHLINEGVE